MMKNIIKFCLLSALTAASFTSCENFEEMNENPYNVRQTDAVTYIQPIVFRTEFHLVQRTRDLVSALMQYAVDASTGADRIYNYRIINSLNSAQWSQLYTQAGNAQMMLHQAEIDEDPTGRGVGLILKVLTMSNITDTYGDVPYFEALKGFIGGTLTPKYDTQKEIYADMFSLLEEANTLLETGVDFEASNDFMYHGVVSQWRKFGNSLYLRLLMRAALKDQAESGELGVVAKISEIFNTPTKYPVFASQADAAHVGFSTESAELQTPFYAIRSGIWGTMVVCDRLMKELYDEAGAFEDPRRPSYSSTRIGAPTQVSYNVLATQYLGRAGVFPMGVLQNKAWYALMNYSEIYFIWAEAAQRGWVSGNPETFYTEAVRQAVLEWTTPTEPAMNAFLAKPQVALSAVPNSEKLERILTQKYVSLFWVGYESWYEFRRTGYPAMPTTELSSNGHILPTRLRYPFDEEFKNGPNYREALGRWLGGENNMQTDVWWADHTDKRPTE